MLVGVTMLAGGCDILEFDLLEFTPESTDIRVRVGETQAVPFQLLGHQDEQRHVRVEGLPDGVSAPAQVLEGVPAPETALEFRATLSATTGGPFDVAVQIQTPSGERTSSELRLVVAGQRGAPDVDFGERGIVSNGITDGWSSVEVADLSLDSQGRALFVVNPFNDAGWVGRAQLDGSPDPAFDSDGRVTPASNETVLAITMRNDDGLYVLSQANDGSPTWSIRHVTEQGFLRGVVATVHDTSYDLLPLLTVAGDDLYVSDAGGTVRQINTETGAVTTLDAASAMISTTVDSAGRVVGIWSGDSMVRRLQPDGTPDASFGDMGEMHVTHDGSALELRSVLPTPEGGGFVIGSTGTGDGYVVRYETAGTISWVQRVGVMTLLLEPSTNGQVVVLAQADERREIIVAEFDQDGEVGDRIRILEDDIGWPVDCAVEPTTGRLVILPEPFDGVLLARLWL